MGGGFMDDMPYYAYNPSMGGQRYPAGSPWGSRNVVRSPYFSEPDVYDVAEPYYNGGVNGYRRMPAGAERYGRGQKPVETAKVPVRKIVVTDGKEPRKESPRASEEAKKPAMTVGKEPRKETPRASEEAKKPAKKWFDNAEDAARYVQSRYRGYVVRKTQPLKHLRIIKEIGEKLKAYQNQACDSEYLEKLRESNMERLKFNEMIMHQLLKLDGLQGVHPVVRDMRKAVTRELVRLQDVTEAAIASGRTPTAGDLKFVETPVNSADEDDAAQSCETEDEMTVQKSNPEEVSLPLNREEEEAAAAAVGRMEIDDEKKGLTEQSTPAAHALADVVEEQPMVIEDCNEVAITSPACERSHDAVADDGVENRAGASSHDEDEEGRTLDQVQPASGQEYIGTATDVEMELPGVHSCSAETVSTSVDGDAVLVDVETAETCTPSTNPISEDVEAEGRKTTRGECDRKRKLEDADVAEASTIEILRQLKRENEQLKQMFEQMMHQQATSICNLSERLERLEDHVRRGKKKPANGRKGNSIRKSRTQMDED